MLSKVYDLHGKELPLGRTVISTIRLYQKLKDNFGLAYFDPVDLDYFELLRVQREIVFKILMAQARHYDVEYVSIGTKDLISPKIKTAQSFAENFTWEFQRYMQFEGSCGNGMGRYHCQYQVSMDRWFNTQHYGVWDPKREVRWTSNSFTLWTGSAKLEKFLAAVCEGKAQEYISDHADLFAVNEKEYR